MKLSEKERKKERKKEKNDKTNIIKKIIRLGRMRDRTIIQKVPYGKNPGYDGPMDSGFKNPRQSTTDFSASE